MRIADQHCQQKDNHAASEADCLVQSQLHLLVDCYSKLVALNEQLPGKLAEADCDSFTELVRSVDGAEAD
jgi:hypothetical protein